MLGIRILLAAIAFGLSAVLATADPASAHDELVASTPSAGEQLTVAPSTVSLTFSGEVLPMGAAVIVVDQTGHDWVDGEPELDGATVTVDVAAGMPDAGYEARWRVVASDGHPISGVIPFTIGDAEPLASATAAAVGGAGTTDTTDTQSQSTQENQGALRVVLIGAGGAAIAVAALLLIAFLRRRTSASSQPGDPSERHVP